MWLYIIPLIVIGVFLAIIWEAINPFHFFRQTKEERARRRREWEQGLEDDEEEQL